MRVVFHDDDLVTMGVVVDVLKRFFEKSDAEAREIMLTVHRSGHATAGIYARDVAESSAVQAMDYARVRGMPLRITIEE